MSAVIGHTEIRRLLEQELPPVTLLRGPQAVGKWTLAMHLATFHQVRPVDQMVIADKLTVAAARALIGFVGTAPFGTLKLVVANLDDASEAALNALLKTLEEPPRTARFLLVASRPVPATVLSRAFVYTLGLLTDEQVRQVLIAQGMSAATAVRSAAHGRGQLVRARAAVQYERQRTTVLAVMRAVATHDSELFETNIRDWDDVCKELLFRWLVEALTREPLLYAPPEFYGFDQRPDLVRKILLRMSAVPAAGSRLGVRAALEPFLSP